MPLNNEERSTVVVVVRDEELGSNSEALGARHQSPIQRWRPRQYQHTLPGRFRSCRHDWSDCVQRKL